MMVEALSSRTSELDDCGELELEGFTKEVKRCMVEGRGGEETH
jgi:hypothetical protein